MDRAGDRSRMFSRIFVLIFVASFLCLCTGCHDLDTVIKAVVKKFGTKFKPTASFVPKDGITIRTCSLYQTANLNSPIMRKLPAETPVFLKDKVGEWYRVRTRDGTEGYLEQKVIGGKEIIEKTRALRQSIEGIPVQAEAVLKTKANFRMDPGRQHEVIEVLPQGKKLEVYERVVTLRHKSSPWPKIQTVGKRGDQQAIAEEAPEVQGGADDSVKKDVWYKVKIEDGRVGYIYTHNMALTPPEDIAKALTWMRMVAWRTVSTTDDPDRGTKNNYVVAYTPMGRDPGCDYTELCYIRWSAYSHQWRKPEPLLNISGILPITNYHYEGKPGFTVRFLHPTKKDKLVLASFIFWRGRIKKISEEEIPNNAKIH
jgi:Bacterial SH3 domain